MKMSPELLKALPTSMGKDLEITYRDGTKVTGFIQGSFSDPDGIIIHKHKWPQGENPLVRASLNNLVELKIESKVYK